MELEDYSLFGLTFYNDENNKIWKHRVNDPDSVNKHLESFAGIELDLFYNYKEDKFYVSHDDDYDIDNTITLEDYFLKIENISESYYWLDLKNLKWTNDNRSIEKMNSLLEEFEIKNNVIIESQNPNLLKKFNEMDIYTSYWVPVSEYDGTLSDNNQKDIEEIEKNLKQCAHNALSSHATNLYFLNKYFPDYNIHIWTNGYDSEEEKELINSFKAYPNVKIILVDFDEPF